MCFTIKIKLGCIIFELRADGCPPVQLVDIAGSLDVISSDGSLSALTFLK
jgi:hypothetical protein